MNQFLQKIFILQDLFCIRRRREGRAMIKQQLYRVDAGGGRTIAVSGELQGSAWLSLLEQQLSLIDFAALPAPVYYQYPLGRSIVMSRCAVNPYTPEKSFIAHQLVLDEAADIDELLAARPVKADLLPAGIFGYTEAPDPLPCRTAHELCAEEEHARCRETLASLFKGDEALLGQFLSAVSLSARDKRLSVRVLVGGTPETVSETGRQVMESVLRVLAREDVVRLSFCSLASPASSAMQFSVRFALRGEKNASDPYEITVDPDEGVLSLPDGIELPSASFAPQAHALLSTEGVSGRTARTTEEIILPPFAEGMSVKQYFADWRAAMEERRASLTEEAFRALASAQWPALITAVIAASDLMENGQFLSELNSVISQIRREKLETSLSMSDNTLTDLLIILLDSILWRQIDLSRPQTAKLLRSICAYSQVLTEEQCPAECLSACRVVYCVLAAPATLHEALNDLRTLESASAAQFEALQDCLRQYLEKRLTSVMDVIDESMAAAAMLGFARFADGIPDLRLADMLTERIEANQGPKAARRFDQMLDKLRSHLHSTHGTIMRRRDMKLFLFISLLLLILIVGITVGFLLLY